MSEFYRDERWCGHCAARTVHRCKESEQPHDPAGSYEQCLDCGWWQTGSAGQCPPLDNCWVVWAATAPVAGLDPLGLLHAPDSAIRYRLADEQLLAVVAAIILARSPTGGPAGAVALAGEIVRMAREVAAK